MLVAGDKRGTALSHPDDAPHGSRRQRTRTSQPHALRPLDRERVLRALTDEPTLQLSGRATEGLPDDGERMSVTIA